MFNTGGHTSFPYTMFRLLAYPSISISIVLVVVVQVEVLVMVVVLVVVY